MLRIGSHATSGSGRRASIGWMSICTKCRKRRKSMAKGSIITNEEQELVLTREFEAPRELVFKVWTDPKHVAQWWGPRGFTNPVCELDLRPAGAILIHMRGPDGTVYPMTGVYQEIVEPERLVVTSAALDAACHPMVEMLTTLTFRDLREQQKQILRARLRKSTA